MRGNQYLFTPLTIGGKTMPSRVLLAPVNTGFASAGQPTDDLVRFHQARSGTDIGVSMVGNVAVSSAAVTNAYTAVLERGSRIEEYRHIAEAIKARGSLAGIQLARSPDLKPSRKWVVNNRGHERNRLADIVSSLTDLSVAKCLEEFVIAAQLAATAGFDVIQVHAAHGYLLSLLLNPLTNRRPGRFAISGPWLQPFLFALLNASRGCILGFRLSIISGLENSSRDELDAATLVSESMDSAGVHFIDYSAGFYTVDRRLIYPGREKGVLPFLGHVRQVTQNVNCVCGVSGNVQNLEVVPRLPANFVVSIGRGLIADSQLVTKTRQGEYDQVVECRRTGLCHHFSRGKRCIECGVNDSVKARLTYV